MVDIKDLRLPLMMAKLDYYVGDWGLSGTLARCPVVGRTLE